MDRVTYPENPPRKQEAQNNKGQYRKSNLPTPLIWKIRNVYQQSPPQQGINAKGGCRADELYSNTTKPTWTYFITTVMDTM